MLPWCLPRHGTLQGKQHFLGYFKEEDDAAATYDAAAMMFMGNHQLNFPDKVGRGRPSLHRARDSPISTASGILTVVPDLPPAYVPPSRGWLWAAVTTAVRQMCQLCLTWRLQLSCPDGVLQRAAGSMMPSRLSLSQKGSRQLVA